MHNKIKKNNSGSPGYFIILLCIFTSLIILPMTKSANFLSTVFNQQLKILITS